MKTTLFAAVAAFTTLFSTAAFAHGHYENREVQVWVDGPCHRPPLSPIAICLPGHYETQVQSVWIEHREGYRWGRDNRYGWR